MPLRPLSREARDPSALRGHSTRLQVSLEGGGPTPRGSEGPPETLRVAAYNLERGRSFAGQLELLRSHPELAGADLLLLSECDRGCDRVARRHVARDLAEALGLHWAFAVQYVELPDRPSCPRRPGDRVQRPCEHGNAILSRYPLQRVRQIRHATTASWASHPREPRFGGVVTLAAELPWAGERLRLYSAHLDSGLFQDPLRVAQAEDLVRDAADHRGPCLIGGDLNAFRYAVDLWLGTRWDPTPEVLRAAGYEDAHASLPPWRRGTTDRSYGVRGAIDLVFTRGLEIRGCGIVKTRGLSDHFPIWVEVSQARP